MWLVGGHWMNVESEKKLPLVMFRLEELKKVKFCKKVLKGKSVCITWTSWPIMGFRGCGIGSLQTYLWTFLKTSSSVNTVNTMVPSSSFIPLLGNIIPESKGPPHTLSYDFSSLRTFIQSPLFIYLTYIISGACKFSWSCWCSLSCGFTCEVKWDTCELCV